MRLVIAGIFKLIFLAAPLPTLGQNLCKWVDARGQTHYSDLSVAQGSCQLLDRAALPPVNAQVPVASAPSKTSRARASRSRPRVVHSTSSSRRDCDAYRERIRSIEQQLRQGYREPAGSRLHARKRRWSELLYERCY